MGHQSASILHIHQHTRMYKYKHNQVPTHTCCTPTRRGQDYMSPLTLQGEGGKNWMDYRRLIEGGATYKDLQGHPFIVETTAGEDGE